MTITQAVVMLNITLEGLPLKRAKVELRAYCHMAKSNIDEAISDANIALWLNTDNQTAYLVRGLCRLVKGELSEAIDDLV
jgi:hypothetical protein